MLKKNSINWRDKIETGDILCSLGHGLIEMWTFSNVRHIGLIYDKKTVFETDLKYGTAGFYSLDKYDDEEIEVYRPIHIDKKKFIELCNKYDKTPYSFWDIFNNIWTTFLHPKIRRKIVGFLGTKWAMVCSEISGLIIYKSTKYNVLKNYEGLIPSDFQNIMILNPGLFVKILHKKKNET